MLLILPSLLSLQPRTLPKTGCQDPGLEAWVQRLRLSRAEDLDCLGSKLGSNPSILCVTLCKFLDASEI